MLGRSLIHQGLLDITSDGYAILKLNPLSWEVMRQQRPVNVAINKQKTSRRNSKEAISNTRVSNNLDSSAEMEMLFQRLRKLRKQLADAQSVPPYVIFPDSTLRELARQQPQNLEDFSRIPGVGKHKLANYGDRFLEEIINYCQENQQIKAMAGELGDTTMATLKLHQQGLSLEAIAQQRGLKVSTISSHLAELIHAGEQVDLDRLVTPERQQVIRGAIEQLGMEKLKPIWDHLEGSYSYEEIRLVASWWRVKNLSQPV